jgi:hypothetical protein
MDDNRKKKPDPERDEIKDFDTLVPEHRWAKIGGEFVDVARIPTETTLRMIRFLDYIDDIKKSGDDLPAERVEKYFNEVVAFLADVCREKNPAITVEFLRTRTTMVQLRAFVAFVVEGVVGKNPQGPAERRGGSS